MFRDILHLSGRGLAGNVRLLIRIRYRSGSWLTKDQRTLWCSSPPFGTSAHTYCQPLPTAHGRTVLRRPGGVTPTDPANGCGFLFIETLSRKSSDCHCVWQMVLLFDDVSCACYVHHWNCDRTIGLAVGCRRPIADS